MECLRSSHSASSTSCSLRCKVRSWVRNRFLASCWVSVEPPCETPRCSTLVTAARAMPIGIDAVMRIEAAVLDGDEGLRQIGRQILQRRHWRRPFRRASPARCRRGRRSGSSAAASGFPATGSPADARRPRSRRRPPRSPPTGRAPRPNRTAGRCRSGRATSTGAWRRCGSRAACARAAARRRSLSALRLADDFFGLLVAVGDAVLRAEAQIGSALRRARIAAPCVRRSFSVPTPYANAAHTGPAAR